MPGLRAPRLIVCGQQQARGAGRSKLSVLASVGWRQHGEWKIVEKDHVKSISTVSQGLAITEAYAPFDGAKTPEAVELVFDSPVTPLHCRWLLEENEGKS